MTKADQYDGARFPELTSAYVEVREDMWKVLVDRLADKMDWRVVEKKVNYSHLSPASLAVTLICQDHGSWTQNSPYRES
jgi:hypothetical protein